MEEVGRPELIKMIREEIEHRGRMPFADFMDLALYCPGQGYYTSPGKKIGREGDYYTSPELHPLFGEMIGRQLAQVADQMSESSLAILEMGAGKGLLCLDILDAIRREHPQCYGRLSYFILEKSRTMIEQQQERLITHIQEGKIQWVEGMEDLSLSKDMNGFVVSNELLDSFPVHRLVVKEGTLREVYVVLKEGKLSEVLDVPSSPALTEYFSRLDLQLEEGQQVEVNLRALDWIRQVGRVLKKGIVITVDYGYPAGELYSTSRKRGTFLCYYRHRVTENPYVRVGLQDMTAHVDFTSLARAGQEAGLEVIGFTNQEYFLMGLGVAQAIEARLDQQTDEASRMRELESMKHLIAPTGMGKVFKILIQQKGLGDLRLNGLSYRPYGPEVLFSL